MRADAQIASVRWHAGALNNGLIFGATYHLVTRLPRLCSYAIGHVGTWLAYRLISDGTSALIDNLRVVRPDATDVELRRLALLTYRSYARDTIDFIRSLRMTDREFGNMIVRIDRAALDDVLARDGGVILVGGHFGNWELGGVALRRLCGYPLTVVGRVEPSPVVRALRCRMRDALGIQTVEIGPMLDTALQIRRLLASNSIVAMLLDRHVGRDRVDVEFFGRSAGFLRTPAMIGYLSGAPLLPAFMVRQSDDRFVGTLGDPIYVDRLRPTETSIRIATQEFARQLEAQVRARPNLWYQFYRYWAG